MCQSSAFARINALVEHKFSRGDFLTGTAAIAGAAFLLPRVAGAAIPEAPKSPLVLANVRIFDGKSDRLIAGKRIVIENDRIKAIEDAGSPVAQGVQVIDGGGRTLMPGLIDAHWHCMMAAISLNELLTADVGYINLSAAEEAGRTLLRGFTSVRDLAGPSVGLKRAIDSGITPGPRIWPSGAMISQTGGHGDYRMPYETSAAPNAPLSHGEVVTERSILAMEGVCIWRARWSRLTTPWVTVSTTAAVNASRTRRRPASCALSGCAAAGCASRRVAARYLRFSTSSRIGSTLRRLAGASSSLA